jgi:hypothetical protein
MIKQCNQIGQRVGLSIACNGETRLAEKVVMESQYIEFSNDWIDLRNTVKITHN